MFREKKCSEKKYLEKECSEERVFSERESRAAQISFVSGVRAESSPATRNAPPARQVGLFSRGKDPDKYEIQIRQIQIRILVNTK